MCDGTNNLISPQPPPPPPPPSLSLSLSLSLPLSLSLSPSPQPGVPQGELELGIFSLQNLSETPRSRHHTPLWLVTDRTCRDE